MPDGFLGRFKSVKEGQVETSVLACFLCEILLLFSGLKSSLGGTHLDNVYYSLAGATLR